MRYLAQGGLETLSSRVLSLPSDEKWLIMIFGQSNATTHAPVSELTDSTYAQAYPSVQVISKQAESLADPFHVDGPSDLAPLTFNSVASVGFDARLMRELDRAAPGKFAMVRYAVGGAGSFDIDDWYDDMISVVLGAKATFGCTRIIGVLEHGERDARDAGLANAYDTWLIGLYDRLVDSFDDPDFLLFFGRVNADLNIGFYVAREEMRASQANANGARAGLIMFDQDSVNLSADGAHYDANGYCDDAVVRAGVGGLAAIPIASSLGLALTPIARGSADADGLDVQFTDASTTLVGTVTGWLWEASDGWSSTSQNPTHTFAEDGEYTYTVTAFGSNGSQSTSATYSIEVEEGFAVTRDPTSLIYYAVNTTEWASLVAAAGNVIDVPDSAWLGSVLSGNLVDMYGVFNLTAANTPLYNQVVSGWTLRGVGATAGSSQRFGASSGTGPNPASTSTLWMWLVDFTSAPAAARQIISGGGTGTTNDISVGINSNSTLYGRCVNATTNGSANHVTGGVRPIFLQHDRVNSVARVVTNEEIINLTYSASVVDGIKSVFASSGGTAAASLVLEGALWRGTKATVGTAALKTFMQTKGFTVAW